MVEAPYFQLTQVSGGQVFIANALCFNVHSICETDAGSALYYSHDSQRSFEIHVKEKLDLILKFITAARAAYRRNQKEVLEGFKNEKI